MFGSTSVRSLYVLNVGTTCPAHVVTTFISAGEAQRLALRQRFSSRETSSGERQIYSKSEHLIVFLRDSVKSA